MGAISLCLCCTFCWAARVVKGGHTGCRQRRCSEYKTAQGSAGADPVGVAILPAETVPAKRGFLLSEARGAGEMQIHQENDKCLTASAALAIFQKTRRKEGAARSEGGSVEHNIDSKREGDRKHVAKHVTLAGTRRGPQWRRE